MRILDPLHPRRSERLQQYIKHLPNLVAYYPMNATDGTSALNRAPATLGTLNAGQSGGVTFGQDGKVGKSFKFDGVDDFLEITNANSKLPMYQYSGGFTIGFFVKCPDYSAADAQDKRFYSEGDSGSLNSLYNIIAGQTGAERTIRFWVRRADGTNAVLANSVSTPLVDNTWQSIIHTDVNGTVQTFVNNVNIAGSTFNYTRPAITPNRFGWAVLLRSSVAGWLNCNMQHAFLVSRALSTDEITKINRIGGFV